MSLQQVIERYRKRTVPPVPPCSPIEGTATGRVVTGCSPCSPCSPTKNKSQNKTQEITRTANPQTEPAKLRKERHNPHLNPEWVAARDEWHRHYFKCKMCQSYYRGKKYRPIENPCHTGKLLHEMYRLACKQ